LKNNVSLASIEREEAFLKQKYTKELIEMYEQELIAFLEYHVGRSHYKTACKYLRRMKKLGALEKVKELIAFFEEKYKMRPALLDELSRV